MFLGKYQHSIDDKKRLTIPNKFRGELNKEFIITRGLEKCLYIYTMEEWYNILKNYKNLPNILETRNFMRIFLSDANVSSLDKQGRINIPVSLHAYAGLIKECIIIGVDDRLEIWDLYEFQKLICDNESNLSNIADSLFAPKLDI